MPATSPPEGPSRSPQRLQTLLVCVDLTPISDRVLGRIPLLPLAEGAQVVVMHVVPDDLPATARSRAEREAERALAAEVRQLVKALPGSVSVQSVVAVGGIDREIVARASAVEAELIVLGRGGGRALRDVFLGSTAERVIRAARRPVLAVRLAPRVEYRHPAVALELDDAAPEVLSLLLRVVPAPRPRVVVIHAIDTAYRTMAYSGLAEDELARCHAELEQAARRQMLSSFAAADAGAKAAGDPAPVWVPHVRPGSARLVIETAVEQLHNDLIVLGTHGRSGLAHWVLGTVSGDVLRNVACDVLIAVGP